MCVYVSVRACECVLPDTGSGNSSGSGRAGSTVAAESPLPSPWPDFLSGLFLVSFSELILEPICQNSILIALLQHNSYVMQFVTHCIQIDIYIVIELCHPHHILVLEHFYYAPQT